ncbi:uncharacterized protein LOC129808044 isoform X2 [Phlebotomus papatasi]|nr:uncharacterized protein LOC129808044 isoform X2 [Phlebotomus papatasi]
MEFFTAPLLCTLKSSQEKIEELEELLKKKDEEIAGYKLSGAILVRKHLETTPFDPQTFHRDHDFSFVNTHNVKKIYNLCGISKVHDSVFSESPKISKNAPSPGTSPSTSKISPIRRSRIMNNLKRPKDEKLLYDDEANSQEIVSNDNVVIVETETPPANPKIRKRLNL